MPSTTQNQTVDAVALSKFQDNFYVLSQQQESRLSGTGVINYIEAKGKIFNSARMGSIDLTEVTGRNPDKHYIDYDTDNRQFTKRRYTATVLIDKEKDINELIADPTSSILKNLISARNRVTDRNAVAAAVGDVVIGSDSTATSTLTAASDGVITIDATSGLTFENINTIDKNFTNNEVAEDLFMGGSGLIGLSGSEAYDLGLQDKYINRDYNGGKDNAGDLLDYAGHYCVKRFAGSETGTGTVQNPIIVEDSTFRYCPVMTKGCIDMVEYIERLDVVPSAHKVNSNEVTISYVIGSMRIEGAAVQIIKTTI